MILTARATAVGWNDDDDNDDKFLFQAFLIRACFRANFVQFFSSINFLLRIYFFVDFTYIHDLISDLYRNNDQPEDRNNKNSNSSITASNNTNNNNLETNDQILAINGILLETSASIQFALESLHKIRCERANKSTSSSSSSSSRRHNNQQRRPVPVEILIARNVDKSLVRKNKKKPHLVLDKFVRAASSSSLSSLASISSQQLQQQQQQRPPNYYSVTNSQEPATTASTSSRRQQLIYCLDDDSLRVTSATTTTTDVLSGAQHDSYFYTNQNVNKIYFELN